MVLRHVSILKDHPQGVCLYLAKVTELFKRFEEFLHLFSVALAWCFCRRCKVLLVGHLQISLFHRAFCNSIMDNVLVFYPLLNWKMHGETMKHKEQIFVGLTRVCGTKGNINLLKPNDTYICRTAALTSRRYVLNIYSTNIHTEFFKHAA